MFLLLNQARRFAEGLENAVWTNQFDNTANRRAHIETTGPEIWEQTGTLLSRVELETKKRTVIRWDRRNRVRGLLVRGDAILTNKKITKVDRLFMHVHSFVV